MKTGAVLLVEDNPQDEFLTLRALRKSGITNEVIVGHDGIEALDYLFRSGSFAGRDPPDHPAVVLMDVNLPKISGLEVLRRIRAVDATRFLPVVILTSSDEEEDRIRGYKLGANSYVRKPVASDAFASAVAQLGLYWLLLNETVPVSKRDACEKRS
jgi:two-component system response regulator